MQLHPCHFDRACEWRNPLLEAPRDSHSDESARTRRPTGYVTVIGLGSRSRITEPVTDQTVAQQHGPQRQGHRRRSATAAAPRHGNRPPLRVGDFSTRRLGRNDTEGVRPHGGVMIVLRNGIVRDRPRSRTPETVTESVAVSGPVLSLPQSLPPPLTLPLPLPQSLVLRRANGGAGILPAVLPSPRRRRVRARAGSPRHHGWWCSKTVSSVSGLRGRVGFRRCTRSLTLSLPLMQLHPCHFDRACEWRNPLLEASRDSHSDESVRTRRPTVYVTVIGLGSRSRITEPVTDQTVAQQHGPQRQGHRRRSATAAAPRHGNRPPLRVGDFSTCRLGRNDTEGARPHGGVMIVLRNGIVRDRPRSRTPETVTESVAVSGPVLSLPLTLPLPLTPPLHPRLPSPVFPLTSSKIWNQIS
jgi:hypothetical protein